jgi:DNA-binding FadR family transcriptional regulator
VDDAPKPRALDPHIVGPIEVPKASDLLAARLREQILTGELAAGAPLPAERDLCAQAGLGRSSVREALRILEHQGFLSTRPGRNGGSVVRLPQRGSLETSLDHFIRGQQLRLVSLLEARQSLEPAAARLAARHRDAGDIAKLGRLHRAHAAAFDDVPRFLRINVEWHLAVTEASHNELLVAFMSAIAQAVHAATDIENFNSDEVRRAALAIHERITDAIRAGDEEAAERRMRRHVGAYAALVESRLPDGPEA